MYLRSRKVQVRLTPELLEMVDKAAKAKYQTRSAFIRECIAVRLNKDQEPSLQDILVQSLQGPNV